jgi:hypothetical protein
VLGIRTRRDHANGNGHVAGPPRLLEKRRHRIRSRRPEAPDPDTGKHIPALGPADAPMPDGMLDEADVTLDEELQRLEEEFAAAEDAPLPPSDSTALPESPFAA